MKKEIERKWIVHNLPTNKLKNPIKYHRYFIFNKNGTEVRIQQKGDNFYFERKFEESDLSRNIIKFEITKEEFELLKKLSIGEIIRDSCLIDGISVKVYKGEHKGLIRAEVEFESEETAKKFIPLDWFGKEITNSVIGKDKKLMNLSSEAFTNILYDFLNKNS